MQMVVHITSNDSEVLRAVEAISTDASLTAHIRVNREAVKMDVVLLLVLAASGLSAVSSQVRRQYHFVYDEKNMPEAQKYCREKHTDLATVDNMEDMKILINTVDKSKVSKFFWIGLYDDLNSWRWSLSDTSLYRDGETEFRLWGSGEPNNVNSREHCTGMYNGRWHDYDCERRFWTVCMDVRGLNVTFIYIKTHMTWTEAQSYCREHHTDLASVRNMTDNQKVMDLLSQGHIAWIGLFRDSWKWSDGSNSSFRHWVQGQPINDLGNDACVVADFGKDGKWWDDPCGRTRPFVCHSLPAVQTTSSSSTTSRTTSSPTSRTTSRTTSSTTSSPTSRTTSSTTQPDAGLSAVSSQVRRQYHFVYDQKNMPEAQKYCREKHTDLATVDNMEDVKILNNTVDTNKSSDLFWIGLYDDVNSWRWSLSDTSFYRDGETEFRLWGSGQPNNGNSREHCTVMYADGQWGDYDCERRFWTVCMDVRGLNVTFVYIKTNMNWTEAQSYCREHHTDLASVRNMTENQKVMDLLPAGYITWIGLFRDSWKWSDGSNSSFRFWAHGEPNNQAGKEACVAAGLGSDGTWYDDPCDRNRPFVCYDPPTTTKQVIKVRLERKDSSLDLNDPAVMEQMLKEVQQRLKDQGVKGDVKLSWRKQADGKVFHKEEEETKKKKKKTRRKRDEF